MPKEHRGYCSISRKFIFKVEIDVSNEPFQPNPWPELARMFQKITDEMRREFVAANLKDINGNKVGTTDFEEIE